MNESRFIQKIKEIGPGAIITATFIGPGTVTTATRAGAGSSFALLWAVVFAIVATIILQEMVARIGSVTKQGLGESNRVLYDIKILKLVSVYIVMIADVIGCAAYISGGLVGTSVGVSYLFKVSENIVAMILGVIILLLALSGDYKVIEKLIIILIIII